MFTARAERAAEVRRADPGLPLFAEHRLDPGAEPFGVFVAPLPGPGELPRGRHPVRVPTAAEMPELLRLARELDGRVDEPWFRTPAPPNERAFVVSIGTALAGQGWVSVVGDHARLHSLMVRPAFRRLGIGTDLVAARLLWARSSGAREALTEIAEGNLASRRIYERAGFRERSHVYLHGLNEAAPARPDPLR